MGSDAVGLHLLGNDVAPADLNLFLLGVSGKPDYFHSVPQRRMNSVQHIGGGHEHDMGQIEWNTEIVIAERIVLLWIKDFEQCGRRIASEIGPHLVDLVEHYQWIVGARLLNCLDYASGHGAYIGAPMTAYFGFVVQSAKAQPLELSIERPSD